MYLALKKCKNECKIFKITLVQIFVRKNLKLLRLLSDFVLIPFFYSTGGVGSRNWPITATKITCWDQNSFQVRAFLSRCSFSH